MRTVSAGLDGRQWYGRLMRVTFTFYQPVPFMTNLSFNAMKVLESRYLLNDGKQESPAGLFRRVASAIASAETRWGTASDEAMWEAVFFEMMTELRFLPNSPTLMNAGTPLNQLSACFVLPVKDNLSSIFHTLKQAALIQQSGGGTGFNFSALRREGSPLTITPGTAAGPLSFMKIFDAATGYIKHGGKRRGANMGVLNVDHPDIFSFICSKSGGNALDNFNISVGISNAFMRALLHNDDWNLIDPGSASIVKTVKAAEIWQQIIRSAWQCGDPGVVFLDTINKANPTPALGAISCTNPCGEVPLLPYESCTLGSLNLPMFTDNQGGQMMINWTLLRTTVKAAIRFLDNVVEINNYLFPPIATMAAGNRKIGLGIMGWADLLMLMEIPYESEAAIDLAKRVMQFIEVESFTASAALARERGVFANWKKSIYYPVSKIRNATRTSIAPTGTISIIANTSSSIEPLYALSFKRQHVLNGEMLLNICEPFVNYLRKHGLYTPSIMEKVNHDGMAGNIDELPGNVKDLFKTSMEISPEWHLKHQLAFQQFTDNAVSKTINLPEHASVDEVDQLYRQAWCGNAKGITVYRNNSKTLQVLSQGIELKDSPCRVCV